MKKLLAVIFILFSFMAVSTSRSQPAPSATVNGLNAFAFDIYNKLSEPDKNVIFSPYSLSSLLGILVTGSAGQTHDQLVNALHLNGNKNLTVLNTELDKMNAALSQNNAIVIANALWADENLTYQKFFLSSLQQNQSIHFFRVNFAHAPDQAKNKINSWVDTTTKGYIKNLIANIPNTTKLVLTNAIYFKGLWRLPFDASRTEQRAFTLDNKSKKNVPMMNQEGKFLYAENDMLQMLQLGYTKSTWVMAVLLPRPKVKLQQLLQAMNSNVFSQLLQSSIETRVNVTLPKFNLDSTFSSLGKSLQAMGLTSAFGKDANFSNITSDKLFISDVIQKAVIQVDEKGTVAAATTGIVMEATLALPEKPINFTADHPFLFIIFDKQSGLILFMGQVTG